eukprot:Phypoly_transcript_24228.p1 GENE.Phypoly_transcript_24228~~Phypoly_transcript_24228.p1  ORF type:complete len:155 (+),score=41.28 Phypoly_transcript_24228:82-546(+)
MDIDKLIAEIQQLTDEEGIDEILASASKLFSKRGQECVAKQDLVGAKAFYTVALHSGGALSSREKEKLQKAIERIDTINKVEKEKRMMLEMQEMQKERETLLKERQMLEFRMREVEEREEEIKEWVEHFEERGKRWAELGAVSRELFVSTLSSL